MSPTSITSSTLNPVSWIAGHSNRQHRTSQLKVEGSRAESICCALSLLRSFVMVKLTLITIIAYLLTLLNSRRASGLNFLHRRSNSQIIKRSAVRHGSQDGAILETSAESQPRPLCKDEFRVSFPYPTGLLVSNVNDVNYCLLQHNVVKLRQSYQRVSQVENAISEKNCAQIIHDAEVCGSLNGGWTANRHSAYPTTDLPLETIFGKFSSIHGLVNGYLLPEIASFFDLNEDFLSIGELFVAKYEYGVNKQAGLGAHVDGTPWSFVISLNNPATDFVGGGTRFIEEGVTYRPAGVGTAVIFSGKNMHEGVPITSGVRYILTGFCNYKNTNTDHDVFMSSYDPHYDGFAASEHQQQRFANSVKSSSKEEQSKVMARFEQSSEKSSYDPFDTNKCGIRTGDILKAIWIPELYPGSSNRFKIHETDFVERVNESGCVMESKGGDGDGVIAGAEMTEHKICDNPTVDSQAIREDFKEDTVDIIDADHEGRYGRYVYLDGLSEEKIKSLVALSGMASESITCSVLVQRDDATMEESYLNEEQRNIPRIASNLLSIGKYWSFDEVIESINSH